MSGPSLEPRVVDASEDVLRWAFQTYCDHTKGVADAIGQPAWAAVMLMVQQPVMFLVLHDRERTVEFLRRYADYMADDTNVEARAAWRSAMSELAASLSANAERESLDARPN